MGKGERNSPQQVSLATGKPPLGLSPRGWRGIGRGCAPGVFQRWFLYPPDKTPHFHPNETTLAWLQHTYPTLPPAQRPLECTLRPGEVSPGAGGDPRHPSQSRGTPLVCPAGPVLP